MRKDVSTLVLVKRMHLATRTYDKNRASLLISTRWLRPVAFCVRRDISCER